MLNRQSENRFNMIEIVIAMSIMVVVIVSVLSLVPKALWSNQEAVSSIAAGDTADQFLNYFAGRLENNWEELEAIPATKYESSSADESSMIFSQYGMLTDSRLNIMYEAPSETSNWDPLVSNKGVFKVQLTSASNQVDFEGYMRVWRSTKDMDTGDAAPKHITLHTEVSWPTSLAYENRRKKTYDLQVFKPGSIAKEASAISSVPCQSVWGIEGAGPTLYYHTLSDTATDLVVKEGDIVGLDGNGVDALTCAPDGNIYFINNHSSETSSTLYKVSRGSIDADPSTDVVVIKVGETGLNNSGKDKITALQFINNKLYGLSYGSQDCYEINYYDGSVKKVSNMSTGVTFAVGGMTIGADGYVYVARSLSSKSELWRFDSFPLGPVTQRVVVKPSLSIESIAGHPSGWVYMFDGTTCFRVEPLSGLVQNYLNYTSSIQDMDFYYLHESNDCANDRSCEGDGLLSGNVSLNPTGTTDYEFEMLLENGSTLTRDDLHGLGASYEYTGKVYKIYFKPKSPGTQNLTLDGEPYTTDNSIAYTLSSDVPFGVHLYNKNTTGTAMGNWFLDLTDAPLTISFCDDGGNTVDGDGNTNTVVQVINGAVVPARDSTVEFEVVSINHKQGGTLLPITLAFSAAGKSYTPFGDPSNPAHDINGTTPSFTVPDTVPAGSDVTARSSSFDGSKNLIMGFSSSPSNSNVQVLLDGNPSPAGGTVSLAENEALIYFELSTTDPTKMDFDSITVKVTVNPL